MSAAQYLAGVVGKTHARQMDVDARRDFRKSLKTRRSKRLDDPSWLWRSVVDLAAAHEAAYLEHCRTYALESSRWSLQRSVAKLSLGRVIVSYAR